MCGFQPHEASAKCGGRGGIRTHDSLTAISAFQAEALDHYATLPDMKQDHYITKQVSAQLSLEQNCVPS